MLDDFEILEPVAQGGMSVVHLARHRTTGRLCALKRSPLPDGVQARNRIRGRLRGGRLQLSHPGILPLLDAGFDDGTLWLATPWVEGGALDPLALSSWAEVRRGLLQLLDALAHVHATGIVHRDVKPQNILVDGDRWLLTDFGILRSMHETDSTGPLGTPSYAAPEQIRGDTALLRPSTDLYAVGILAWQLVAGLPPFTGTTGSVIRQHLESALPRLVPRMSVPVGLEGWLARLLCKAQWDRPPYAALAAARLRELGPPTTPAGGGVATFRAQDEATIDLDAQAGPSMPSRPTRPKDSGSEGLLPFPSALPPDPNADPPPELPRGLRALVPRRHPPLHELWGWLSKVVQTQKPMVVEVPDAADPRRVVREAVRLISSLGVGFTLYGERFTTGRYLTFLFTEEPTITLGVARSVGVPADLDWLARVKAGEPAPVADMLCRAGARAPVLAVFRDEALAAEMRCRSTGAVLLLHVREDCPDDRLRLQPADVAGMLVQHLGVDPEEASERAAEGLATALLSYEAGWLRPEPV